MRIHGRDQPIMRCPQPLRAKNARKHSKESLSQLLLEEVAEPCKRLFCLLTKKFPLDRSPLCCDAIHSSRWLPCIAEMKCLHMQLGLRG